MEPLPTVNRKLAIPISTAPTANVALTLVMKSSFSEERLVIGSLSHLHFHSHMTCLTLALTKFCFKQNISFFLFDSLILTGMFHILDVLVFV